MTLLELLIYIVNGFSYFLIGIGISTIFFPVKMSLHPPIGVLLGIAVSSSYWGEEEPIEIEYVFFQIHLLFFSLGVFINLGEKK